MKIQEDYKYRLNYNIKHFWNMFNKLMIYSNVISSEGGFDF